MVTADRPALQPSPTEGFSLRLFASARREPRSRRLLDLIGAVVALALLALLAWWSQPPRDFELALIEAAASSPPWLHTVWVVAYDTVALFAVLLLVAAAVRKRWPMLGLCGVALVAASVLVVLVARWTTGDWSSFSQLVGWGDAVSWPAAGLTLSAAVLMSVAADITAPARSLAGWAVGIAAVAGVLAARTTPTGIVAAVLTAYAAASIARLAIGTAAGHLSRKEVLAILEGLGVTGVKLDSFDRQPDGVVLVEGRAADGEPLLIKVLGRDIAERRRVHRLWRSLVYRDGGAAFAAARRPGLSSETLATLLAETHDVPVWRVVTAGQPGRTGEALVLVTDGHRVSALPEGTFDDALAAGAWQTVQALHAARIAHLDLSPRTLAVRADRSIALTDLTDATLAAGPDLLGTDDAQLVVTLAVLLGPERAVASARKALDDARLNALLPFLQPPALPYELRRAAKAAKLDFDELRAAVAKAAGEEAPELAKLQRMTWGGLLRAGLLVLAASVIVPFIAGLDIEALREAFSTATIPLIILAFVVAQTPRLAQAISTLGSVPARLPFVPVYIMQLATSFMNIALPSATARMALTVRFFQRQGLAPATALTSGLVDSFVGNVVQVLLLGSMLLFSSMSLDLDSGGSTGTTSGDDNNPLIVLIVVAVLSVVVALVVSSKLRHQVVGRLKAWWPDVKAAAGPLRNRHNIAQLLGGNIAAELLFAAALALFVHAFHGDISLIEALFVNMSASLLISFVPVPGGIGIAESALIVGLGRFGIAEDVAFAAVISYRLSTFYLPPIWGWVAMRWLGNNGYL